MTVSLKQMLKSRLLPSDEGLIGAARVLATELQIKLTRSSTKPFQALREGRDLRINLGCGSDIRPGWVNIDLGLGYKTTLRGERVFVAYDLRRGMPLAAGSCSYIYSSHFFEHLEYRQGLRLMADCHRALELGGRFRIALPNYRALFAAYLSGEHAMFDLLTHEIDEPTSRQLADYMTYIVYQHGEHKCIYDEERLTHALCSVGFSKAESVSYQAGVDPDTELRRRYSFYVEAVR